MTSLHNICRRFVWLIALFLVVLRLDAEEPKPTSESAFHDARQLYDDGKTAEALAAFQQFESNYGFSIAIPQAIYLEAWCLADLQKYPDAISTFDRLFKSYPSAGVVPAALLKQAECYRAATNYTQAVACYRQFETKCPKHEMLPQAMLGEAWTLFQQNDFDAAKGILQNIHTRFAADSIASVNASLLLGQILIAQKDYDAARQAYGQIPSPCDDPRTTESFFLAGEAMFDAKRYADAIPYYECVQPKSALLQRIQKQIDDLQPQRATLSTYDLRMSDLRQLQSKVQGGPDLRASALFRLASCYQSLGRPEEAAVAYREFLSIYSNDPLAEQAQFGLVQMLTARHALDEADVESREFQKKFPSSVLADDTLFLQAETLFSSGQFQQALDRFQKFAATNKNPSLRETADFRTAACYYGLGNFSAARDGFQMFLRKHTASKLTPDALFRLGRSWFELSQKATDPKVMQANLTEAINNYEQIRINYPTSELIPEITFQLGYLHAYLAAKDIDKASKLTTTTNVESAVASFQEFIQRWPDNRLAPEALYQIARNQFAEGKPDAAIETYQQLAEKYPDSDLALFGAYEIADCYASEGKTAEMIAALRDFVKRYPNHVRVGNALYAIASQLESEKKPDAAIIEYRDVINRAAAAPNLSADLRDAAIASELRIASILESRGHEADAIADYESLLAKFQDEPVAVRTMVAQITAVYRKDKAFNDGYAKLNELTNQYQENAAVRIATATGTIDLALAENDTQHAYAAALKLVTEAEKTDLPPTSYLALGSAMLHRDQFAVARDAYQRVLDRYPGDARSTLAARLGWAKSELGLNQIDSAEAAFNQVIATDPNGNTHTEAELGLAMVDLMRGYALGPNEANNVRAVDRLNRVMANAKDEEASDAAFLLGNYFFNFKDNEKENKKTALAYYLRVALLTSGPRGEEAAFRSGQCHLALGNVEAARSAFQAYLRRFPSGQFATEAKQELESLPPPPQQS